MKEIGCVSNYSASVFQIFGGERQCVNVLRIRDEQSGIPPFRFEEGGRLTETRISESIPSLPNSLSSSSRVGMGNTLAFLRCNSPLLPKNNSELLPNPDPSTGSIRISAPRNVGGTRGNARE
jgi:hypothetical protein